jgi:phage minor structural protein
MSYPVLYRSTEELQTPAIAGIAIAGLTVIDNTTEHSEPFTTQGLGVLSDSISCKVTEERNGSYELVMTYPASGINFSRIAERCIVVAKPNYADGPQPFRIYKITKPLNGICTIYAQHISYDLTGYEVPTGQQTTTPAGTCALLTKYAPPYTITTTMTGTATFRTTEPASVRAWMGGRDGSVIDLFGGEWHWDGYTCTLMSARGRDRGVRIAYGKNLTALTQELDCSNLYTAVMAYFIDPDGNLVEGGKQATGLTLDEERILFIDASAEFAETPDTAELNSYAATYIAAHNLTAPTVDLTLDFIQMQGLAERVELCDTVTVEFEALGVSSQVKCIMTEWDVLEERYTKTRFGDKPTDIADTITQITNSIGTQAAVVKQTMNNTMTDAIRAATLLISGNSGGYLILRDTNADGKPDELLIMDTPNITTATKVWRWNKNGLGYSSTGYNGTYGLAMTASGQIVADFITTGTLSADRINGGTLVLGGLNDVDGVLKVYDADGTLITTLDSDGINTSNIDITGGSMEIEAETMNTSVIRIHYANPAGTIDCESTIAPYKIVNRGWNNYVAQLAMGALMFLDENGVNKGLIGLGTDATTGKAVASLFLSNGDGHKYLNATGGYLWLYDGTGGAASIALNGNTGQITCDIGTIREAASLSYSVVATISD